MITDGRGVSVSARLNFDSISQSCPRWGPPEDIPPMKYLSFCTTMVLPNQVVNGHRVGRSKCHFESALKDYLPLKLSIAICWPLESITVIRE